jgi:hypothetical protein
MDKTFRGVRVRTMLDSRRVVILSKLGALKVESSLPFFNLNLVWLTEKISYNQNYFFNDYNCDVNERRYL